MSENLFSLFLTTCFYGYHRKTKKHFLELKESYQKM